TQLALQLRRRLRHRPGGRIELLDPEVERSPADAQIARHGRTGALAIDVHFHRRLFELLIVDTFLFSWSVHGAMMLCLLPLSLSTKWGEPQVQMGQMGQAGYPGQAGYGFKLPRAKPSPL